MIPVSQKTLVRTRVRFRDAQMEQATVFPMFDARGKVRRLVLVDHLRHEVYHLVWCRGLVKMSWFGGVVLSRNSKGLSKVDADIACRMTDLWHYDPWWLLKESPFAEHEATPGLKDTNCVDDLTGVTALYFRRDLSTVTFMHRLTGAGALEIATMESGALPERACLQAPGEQSIDSTTGGGWQLRPFWDRTRR